MSSAGERLLFAEWSCEEGSDPHDFENWKLANPSLGVDGISPVEALEEDYTAKMDIQQFAREHLGMWDDPAMNSPIPFDQWSHEDVEVDAGPDEGLMRAVCVDIDPDSKWGSIAVAELWPDGRHHFEVLENHAGTGWILGCMQRLISSSNPPVACVVQTNRPAGALGPELELVGYKVRYWGTTDVAHATTQFAKDIENRRATHIADSALKAALGGSAKYDIGNPDIAGAWGWIRKNRSVDITSIVACSYVNRLLTLESVEQQMEEPPKAGKMWVNPKYR